MADAFDIFDPTKPENPEPTLQTLYEYERYYMELVKKFQSQIEFINSLHMAHTQEITKFHLEDLPAIERKLQSLPISENVRNEWIISMREHMMKSFEMSLKFIDTLTTKNIEEFDVAIKSKINGRNVS